MPSSSALPQCASPCWCLRPRPMMRRQWLRWREAPALRNQRPLNPAVAPCPNVIALNQTASARRSLLGRATRIGLGSKGWRPWAFQWGRFQLLKRRFNIISSTIPCTRLSASSVQNRSRLSVTEPAAFSARKAAADAVLGARDTLRGRRDELDDDEADPSACLERSLARRNCNCVQTTVGSCEANGLLPYSHTRAPGVPSPLAREHPQHAQRALLRCARWANGRSSCDIDRCTVDSCGQCCPPARALAQVALALDQSMADHGLGEDAAAQGLLALVAQQ